MITKKLSKHGNSLALVIDRSILELLGIDERTTLDISTDGRALVILPAQQKGRRKRFQDALATCNQQYGKHCLNRSVSSDDLSVSDEPTGPPQRRIAGATVSGGSRLVTKEPGR